VAGKLEFALGILNGAVGDYLERTKNPLATEMSLVRGGAPFEAASFPDVYPSPSARVAVLVHGLMCTESIWEMADGSDYGTLLERDLGITPLYVRYNSGRSIADNGASLAMLLESIVDAHPRLAELVLVGFSMGGLVLRSACHVASMEHHRWLGLVSHAIYLGTPHRGAPLERAGRALTRVLRAIPDPYTRLASELAELRSDGVKDLGDADLTHEDRTRPRGFSLRDPQHPVPLLPSIEHHLVAASVSTNDVLATALGDTIVPIRSAAFEMEDVVLLEGRLHLDLAHDLDAYAHIRRWCEA
jgi:pimeloyl-ACP methyl ester carboxylesterase